jgi:hypothetical protein
MRRIVGAIACLVGVAVLIVAGLAWAQQVDSVQQGSTITTGTGSTFQQVLPANNIRRGCTIQNPSTHNMNVFWGPIASAVPTTATSGNSFVLLANAANAFNCGVSPGIVIRSQISINGTSGDAYIYSEQ